MVSIRDWDLVIVWVRVGTRMIVRDMVRVKVRIRVRVRVRVRVLSFLFCCFCS